ncbi:hypothetical protein ENSA5_07860 [Enhygromyxa salina]|uniref:Roadblock/LAMTOR2 domain-containing protein n=1 Tax=Enhygromyxa salina TaxID=215803 RepID=A0A2S9YGY6_9BACT|nr:hypothetical protein [Enhygromyxa salina]PRQ04383.1 hypothetical protein ENSA5_07860 [Enhygromyxa salina]
MASEHDSADGIDEIDRGVSEFGDLLGDLLELTPGGCGVVLSDGVDDTIDTAYRPAEISALDISIAGAQIGQAMTRMNISTIIFGLGRAQLVIEAGESVLISKVLWEEYLMTMVLSRRANIARAMRDFDDIAAQVLALLR